MRYEVTGKANNNIFITIIEAESEEELQNIIKERFPGAEDIEAKVLQG